MSPPAVPVLALLLALPAHAEPVALVSLVPRAPVEAPATLLVLDEATLRRRGYTHLGEVLVDLPEVEVHAHTSAESDDRVTVRGLAEGAPIRVLVDGVRVGPPDGTPWVIAENYPLVGVERVEVGFGPTAAVYGTDGAGMVVNLVTRPGAAVQGLRAGGAIGSFADARLDLSLGGRWGDFDVVATGARRRSDGARLPDVDPNAFDWYGSHYVPEGLMLVSPWSQAGVEVAPEAWSNRREAWFVDVHAQGHGLTVGVIAHHQSHPSATGSRPEYAVYGEGARYGGTMTLAWLDHGADIGGDHLRWSSRAEVGRFTLDPDSAFQDALTGYETGWVYQAATGARVGTDLIWHPTGRVDAALGVEADTLDGVARTGTLDHPFDPTLPAEAQAFAVAGSAATTAAGSTLVVPAELYTFRSVGAAARGEVVLRPTDTLSLTAGVRVDRRSTTGWAVDPRAAVILRPLPGARLGFLYGESSLDPTPWDTWRQRGGLGAETDDTGAVVGLESPWRLAPSPDLDPGRSRTYEVTASGRLLGVLQLDGDAFVSRLQGLPVPTTSSAETWSGWPVAETVRAANLGSGWVGGGTARGSVEAVLGAWTLAPSLAYTHVTGEVDGAPLPWAAAHTVKTAVDVGWEQVSLSTRVRWRSASSTPDAVDGTDPTAVSAAATRVDLHAGWSPGMPGGRFGATLSLDVANLLDARTTEPGDGSPLAFDAVPQDPRVVRVGLEMKL